MAIRGRGTSYRRGVTGPGRGGARAGAGRRRLRGSAKRNEDGLVVSIKESDLGIDLADVKEALKNFKPAFNPLKEKRWDQDPENYMSPERMTRDPMPKRGDKTSPPPGPPFGPGYLERGQLRSLKKSLKLATNRWYHPMFSHEAVDEIMDLMLDHIVGGEEDSRRVFSHNQ